jgi:heme O synthase-like polyprenyltransferase
MLNYLHAIKCAYADNAKALAIVILRLIRKTYKCNRQSLSSQKVFAFSINYNIGAI